VTGFLIRLAISALGLWIAARFVPGIEIHGDTALLLAALLLGVVNAVVRPVVVLLTLPVTLLTLGLFLWVVNAAMFGLVAALLDGFQVADFSSALLGALLVSVTSWFASSWVAPSGRVEVIQVRVRPRQRGR
jgi:putative membrane protein